MASIVPETNANSNSWIPDEVTFSLSYTHSLVLTHTHLRKVVIVINVTSILLQLLGISAYLIHSPAFAYSFILEQKTSLQGVWLYILCKLFKSKIINSKITSTICAYGQLTHSLIDSLHPSLTYFPGTLAYSDPNIPHRVCITCANTLTTQQNGLRYQLSRANKGIELIYSLILTNPSLTRNV